MLRNFKVLGPRKALKGKFNRKGLRFQGRRVRDKNLCCAATFHLLYSPSCYLQQCLSKFAAVLSSSKFRSCTAHSALRLHPEQMQLLACELWAKNNVSLAEKFLGLLRWQPASNRIKSRSKSSVEDKLLQHSWCWCWRVEWEERRFAFYARLQTNWSSLSASVWAGGCPSPSISLFHLPTLSLRQRLATTRDACSLSQKYNPPSFPITFQLKKMAHMCWPGLRGLTGVVTELWLCWSPPLPPSPATFDTSRQNTARDQRAHLDRQVKVVADPPLQLLHVLAHPLHRLVRAVHAQLQLWLLLRQLLLNCILVQHLNSQKCFIFTIDKIGKTCACKSSSRAFAFSSCPLKLSMHSSCKWENSWRKSVGENMKKKKSVT